MLKLTSSMATRQILADLLEQREVAIKSMGGLEAAKLVRSGEATDIVILASGVMEKLEAEGHIRPGSRAGFARSGMAVAVRSGTGVPDIGTGEALKKAVLAADKVGYSTGPSGDHLLRLLDQWDITKRVTLLQASPGVPVGAMIARGEADLGFQQLSELQHVPGIEIVGPLPPDVQLMTVFMAGVAQTSSQAEAAAELITFLTSPETEDVKRGYGMEPA